jgi:hypothetical protein
MTLPSLRLIDKQLFRACSRSHSMRRCCSPALQHLPTTSHCAASKTRVSHEACCCVAAARVTAALPRATAAPLPDVARALLSIIRCRRTVLWAAAFA